MKDICWIEGNPPAALAIVMRPRGGDWLDAEMARFMSAGIDTVVSLLEDAEAATLGLSAESQTAESAGLEFLSFPIRDVHVPDDAATFRCFIEGLASRLRANKAIGVHCRGSIGRATVTAACTLIHLGWKPEAALAAIEATRGCHVPDTEEQRRWIVAYKARL